MALLLSLPVAAQAAYPGSNGKIAFIRDWQVWTMNADGTGQTQVTSDASIKSDAEWSPNGTRIAYTAGAGQQRQVRVMNPDGTGDTQVAPAWAYSPTWSPDGSRIAFVAPYFDNEFASWIYEVVEADLDGSHGRRIAIGEQQPSSGDLGPVDDVEWSPRGDEITFTDGPEGGAIVAVADVPSGAKRGLAGDPCCYDAFRAAWSPDGGKLAFIRMDFTTSSPSLWTIDRDGSGLAQVTTALYPLWVEWSPDGTKLVFSEFSGGNGLYSVNPDGTQKTRLTTSDTDYWPHWQPVIESAEPGYPRPKSASPLTVSLVPGYVACTSPNRQHGPPLAFPSCAPPSQASSFLTVGTADSNGAAANNTGRLRMSLMDIAPGLPQSDVLLTLDVSDVRCRTGVTAGTCTEANFSAGPDYSGRLEGFISLRITDRYNLPSPGGRGAGTVAGGPSVRFDVECTTTPGTSGAGTNGAKGSNCSTNTTVNALLPGAVAERRRSIWEVADVSVDGQDGTPFLRPGVFIP